MTITSINTQDVAKITSGQVIIDLVSVVKELVDNSLDAGADKIEITFSAYGAAGIEVTDSGKGIDASDFDSLCLKHHTSKLTTFEDLSVVTTLGFRGEAMSSICSLAKVKVLTCTEATFPRGTTLDYDSAGKLVGKKTAVTGKKGTVVSVSDLFHALPVRQKNFVKHSKREYTKTLSLLMAYMVVYTKVRFTVFNISQTTNKKSMVLATQGGSASTTDALVHVYGSNGAYGLVPIDVTVKNIDARFKLSSQSAPLALNIRLSGLISDYSFGLGRGAKDRQFLSINKRPVTHKKIAKIINEVYKTFNSTQSPVFVLDLELDTFFVDVNVTPDKRLVMMQCEDLICEVVREELTLFYDGRHNVVPKSEIGVVKIGGPQPASQPMVDTKESTQRTSRREAAPTITETFGHNEDSDASEKHEQENQQENEQEDEPEEEQGEENENEQVSDQEIDEDEQEGDEAAPFTVTNITLTTESGLELAISQHEIEPAPKLPKLFVKEIHLESDLEDEEHAEGETSEDEETSISTVQHSPEIGETQAIESGDTPASASDHAIDNFDDMAAQSFVEALETEEMEMEIDESTQPHQGEELFVPQEEGVAQEQESEIDRPRSSTATSLCSFRGTLKIGKIQPHAEITSGEKSGYVASVHDITEAMEIRKEDFGNMSVVGQFNSGFIIVTHQGRLFIVDQHALDEIYNYELLMRTLVLRAQPLVVPRTLELSPIDEMVVLEHVDQLRKNGFVVESDEEAPPGQRVRLVAVPVLKNVVFDDSDLHELVHKLHELGGGALQARISSVRCTKVDKMIALRACRLSIMVGLALLRATMATVLKHLTTLNKPWNCPHGRPTMRHLADLQGRGFIEDYVL